MGRPNKPDHPWKKPLSAKKAAQDREAKKYAAKNKLDVTGSFPSTQIGAYKKSA